MQRDGLFSLFWAFPNAARLLGRAHQLRGYLEVEIEWLAAARRATELSRAARALRVQVSAIALSAPPYARECYDGAKACDAAFWALMKALACDQRRPASAKHTLARKLGSLAHTVRRSRLDLARQALSSAGRSALGPGMTGQLRAWVASDGRHNLASRAQCAIVELHEASDAAPPLPTVNAQPADVAASRAAIARALELQLEATCRTLLASGSSERWHGLSQVLCASARIRCLACTPSQSLEDWDKDFHRLHSELEQRKWTGSKRTMHRSVHAFVSNADYASRSLHALPALAAEVDKDNRARPERDDAKRTVAAQLRRIRDAIDAEPPRDASHAQPDSALESEAGRLSQRLAAHHRSDDAVAERWAEYCKAVETVLHRHAKLFGISEVLNDVMHSELVRSASILNHETATCKALTHALSATVHAARDALRLMRCVVKRHTTRRQAGPAPSPAERAAWQYWDRMLVRLGATLEILDAQQAAADRRCRAGEASARSRHHFAADDTDRGRSELISSQRLRLESAHFAWLSASHTATWDHGQGANEPSHERRRRLTEALNALLLAEVSLTGLLHS